MSFTIFADVVVGIPYGNEGKKRWQKVGVLLKPGYNDEGKGPGLVVMLDRYFNPAGVPTEDPLASSVVLSTYWPGDKTTRKPPSPDNFKAPRPQQPPLEDLEDDIPF